MCTRLLHRAIARLRRLLSLRLPLEDSATSERRPRDSAGDAADLRRLVAARDGDLVLCRDLPDLQKKWTGAVRSLAGNPRMRCGDANRVMWLRLATTDAI